MKRVICATLLALATVAGSGCASKTGLLHKKHAACGGCGAASADACGCGLGSRLGNHLGQKHQAFNPGPPSAQVAYPYYSVRGPRDFLMSDPPPLGP